MDDSWCCHLPSPCKSDVDPKVKKVYQIHAPVAMLATNHVTNIRQPYYFHENCNKMIITARTPFFLCYYIVQCRFKCITRIICSHWYRFYTNINMILACITWHSSKSVLLRLRLYKVTKRGSCQFITSENWWTKINTKNGMNIRFRGNIPLESNTFCQHFDSCTISCWLIFEAKKSASAFRRLFIRERPLSWRRLLTRARGIKWVVNPLVQGPDNMVLGTVSTS